MPNNSLYDLCESFLITFGYIDENEDTLLKCIFCESTDIFEDDEYYDNETGYYENTLNCGDCSSVLAQNQCGSHNYVGTYYDYLKHKIDEKNKLRKENEK